MGKQALVVVLGDLARSPRMQYHCISLASNNYAVTVIAFGGGQNGDRAHDELESNDNVRQLLLSTSNSNFRTFLPRTLAYITKTIWLTLLLIHKLFLAPAPDIILVQNPPSVPTLPILYFYSRIIGSRLIIDWHNYGFTIFQLQHAPRHPLVRLMKFMEISFGRLADAGFCVSNAMRKDLIENFRIRYPLSVLYDKPPKQFEPTTLQQNQEFFAQIKSQIPEFNYLIDSHDDYAVILSSTSWTEDEDFEILLEALEKYEKAFEEGFSEKNSLPKLFCVITGKGPLKSHFESRIETLNFKHVKLVLPWLSANHYPRMVSSCDLGISLHSSSSGVDLPMKVVDFFGCGIPVLAYKYPTINELVIEDQYGMTFENADDLYTKLIQLLENNQYRKKSSRLARYRKSIINNYLKHRWEENWDRIAKPLLEDVITRV